MAMITQNDLIRRHWFLKSRTTPIEDSYDFQEELGSGAYGKVYRITSKDSPYQSFAVKIIQKNRVKDFKTFKKEVKTLSKLDHPNIIKV